MRKPRIAVILDENTSGDATRYEAAKGYFRGVRDAGGLPFGIPYLPEIVQVVLEEFDGLLSVGGRFAYPMNGIFQARFPRLRYPSASPSSAPLSKATLQETSRCWVSAPACKCWPA